MKLFENMLKNAEIAIELLYYHMNMNLIESLSDST